MNTIRQFERLSNVMFDESKFFNAEIVSAIYPELMDEK